jgi:hypothetical protein
MAKVIGITVQPHAARPRRSNGNCHLVAAKSLIALVASRLAPQRCARQRAPALEPSFASDASCWHVSLWGTSWEMSDWSPQALQRGRSSPLLLPIAIYEYTPWQALADCCERGRCVAAMFGVRAAPVHEEPRSGSNNSEHESTSGRSTSYGSGHLVRVFHDIERIYSLLCLLSNPSPLVTR